METSELENSLYIVFEKEESDIEGARGTYAIEQSKENGLSYPNAETLIDLFFLIKNDVKLRSFFVESLKERIADSDKKLFSLRLIMGCAFVSISPLCFYVLVKLGFVDEAIDSLMRRYKGCEGLYRLILYLIPMDYFDIAQLKVISTKVKSEQICYDLAKKIELIIIEKRYQLLNKKIKQINIEINQDKKAVSEKMSMLGFDKSYNQLLDEIDGFINTETSTVVNAGMISTLRAFMANLQKDIANKIAQKEGETIPAIEGRREMGNIRGYLKKKLDLSDNDDKFVDSFVDILHSEGGHAFMSEKEYFRLARNIAIEIALFILSKYEKKFKS
jgi:hypothetical protein